MVATWLYQFDNGILLPTSFEILVSDVIHGYVLPIVRISIRKYPTKLSCHDKATDFIREKFQSRTEVPLSAYFTYKQVLIYFD